MTAITAAPPIVHHKMLIGGEWTRARNERVLESQNPYTGQVWATVPDASAEDVERAVQAARHAFDHGPWGRSTARERSAILRKLGDLLAENAEHLASVESMDNGKLLKEMLARC